MNNYMAKFKNEYIRDSMKVAPETKNWGVIGQRGMGMLWEEMKAA